MVLGTTSRVSFEGKCPKCLVVVCNPVAKVPPITEYEEGLLSKHGGLNRVCLSCGSRLSIYRSPSNDLVILPGHDPLINIDVRWFRDERHPLKLHWRHTQREATARKQLLERRLRFYIHHQYPIEKIKEITGIPKTKISEVSRRMGLFLNRKGKKQ